MAGDAAGGFIGGFLGSYTEGIVKRRREEREREDQMLEGRLGVLQKLAGMPDVQGNPQYLKEVIGMTDETLTGRAWQEKPKRGAGGQGKDKGHQSHLQMLGHVLAPIGHILSGNVDHRQLKPLDLGEVGTQNTEVGVAGQALPSAPGYGIASTFKTPEQRQEQADSIAAGSENRDRQRKVAAIETLYQNKNISQEQRDQLLTRVQTGITESRLSAANTRQLYKVPVTDETGKQKEIPGFFDPVENKWYKIDGKTPLNPDQITGTPTKSSSASGRVSATEQQNTLSYQSWAEEHKTSIDKMTATNKIEAQAIAKNKAREGQGGMMSHEDIDALVEAIITGKQPPILNGLRNSAGPVRAALAKKGFDLTQASLDWRAMEKYVSVQNGERMQRLQQATEFSSESLDLLSSISKDLSKHVDRSRFPVVNKAAMAWALSGAGGQEAQNAASSMQIQIADLRAELATVYKGGGSPTDSGLKQAMDILDGDWDESRLNNAISLSKKNLTLRLNSLRNIGISGMSPNSVYTSQVNAARGVTGGGAPSKATPQRVAAPTSNGSAGPGKGKPKTAAEFDALFPPGQSASQ